MSEVIEARGHPGRESHESRASGREQCRESVIFPPLSLSPSFLPFFLPPLAFVTSIRVFSSLLSLSSSSSSTRSLDSIETGRLTSKRTLFTTTT